MRTPQIPEHSLLRKIGSGSYGEVWLARNVFGAYRAVKIIQAGTEDQERHLEREFEGIKKFEPISRSHEGFVDILQAGHDREQRIFYCVMELGDDQVTGQNISPETYAPRTMQSEIKTQGRLSVADCVRYGLLLSDALRSMHHSGLLHRDIKPSNIIFIKGAPKLGDIGLVTEIEEAKSYVGTDGFIPPEGPTSIQADVYALGKVLYEMSTGQDRKAFPALADELWRFPDAAQFRDLNEIIVRACHSERKDRYSSATPFYEELVVLHQGRSIKRLRSLEKTFSILKRAGLFSLIVLPLLTSLGFFAVQRWKFQVEARHRQAGRAVADAVHSMEGADLLGSIPFLAQAIECDGEDEVLADAYWLRLHSVLNQVPSLSQFWRHPKLINSICWRYDGLQLLVAERAGKASIWDPESGEQIGEPFGPTDGLMAACFSPDGNLVLTASFDKTARIYNAPTRELLHRIKHPQGLYSAAFSHNGQFIVTACEDGQARVFDLATCSLLFTVGTHPEAVLYAAFSPDDQLIVTTSKDHTARFWKVADQTEWGKPLRHGDWVYSAAFSPNGSMLVTACFDRTARIWDIERGALILPELKHNAGVSNCRFSPDGAWVITASFDSTVHIWNAATHQPEGPVSVLYQGAQVMDAAIAPEGSRIASGCEDGTVRVWDLASTLSSARLTSDTYSLGGDQVAIITPNSSLRVVNCRTRHTRGLQVRSSVLPVAVSEDGEIIATVSPEPTPHLEVWRASGFTAPFLCISNVPERVVLCAEGSIMVTLLAGRVNVHDLARGKEVFEAASHATDVALHPGGELLLITKGNETELRLVPSGELRGEPIRHPGRVSSATFDHSGARFIITCNEHAFARLPARIYDTASGKPIGLPLLHRDGILSASFSPDDRFVITCGEDFTARVWDVETSRLLFPPLEHQDQVGSAGFSPDGRWIVTSSANGMVRIWDAKTGEIITPNLAHPFPIKAVRFVGTGSDILATDRNGGNWLNRLNCAPMPLADLKECALVLCGGGAPGTFVSTEKDSSHFIALWQSLRGRYPALFQSAGPERAAWHRERARFLRKARNINGAEFHERLTVATPSAN